jgi:hypothetical protein
LYITPKRGGKPTVSLNNPAHVFSRFNASDKQQIWPIDPVFCVGQQLLGFRYLKKWFRNAGVYDSNALPWDPQYLDRLISRMRGDRNQSISGLKDSLSVPARSRNVGGGMIFGC